MLAFEYTPGWGALLTLVGTLGGVMLAQRSARSAERERTVQAAAERAADRVHERELRELELRDAHLARLQDRRLEAYREFRTQLAERRRLADVFSEVEARTQNVRGPKPQVDAARAEQQAAGDASQDAARALDSALAALDLVASRPVRAMVAKLRDAVSDERLAWLGLRQGSEDWGGHLAAQESIRAAEDDLREAIADELGLDRGWGDDRPSLGATDHSGHS